MKKSFTLERSHVLATDSTALMHEVLSHTGCEGEAESILRSVVRIGSDESIGHYEITPKPVQRAYRDAAPVVWSVRAVRDDPGTALADR